MKKHTLKSGSSTTTHYLSRNTRSIACKKGSHSKKHTKERGIILLAKEPLQPNYPISEPDVITNITDSYLPGFIPSLSQIREYYNRKRTA